MLCCVARQAAAGRRRVSPPSERYRLVVTAFAARRLEVCHKRGCRARISKSSNFFILGEISEQNVRTPMATILQIVKVSNRSRFVSCQE